jgi:hypothetical protein
MLNMCSPFLSYGIVEAYRVPLEVADSSLDTWRKRGWLMHSGPNKLVFSGVDIMTRLLTDDTRKLDGLYIEFANTADPSGIVPPTVDPLVGVEYYTSLSGDHDYLRVPLRVEGDFEASDTRYSGNRVRFIGVSGGANGVRGLPFGSAAGSVAYGAALALLGKTPADDLIYSRVYMVNLDPVGDNQAIGISWSATLLHPEH